MVERKIYYPKETKVAVIHDTLFEYGGSEKVAIELLNLFPGANFYTLYFNKSNPIISSAFKKFYPRTSFLQNIPGLYKLGRYFSITKIISWIYFYFLDLSKYDLIIASSYSFNSKMLRKSKLSYYLCYLHTPPKHLYREINEIQWIKTFPFNFILFPLFSFLRFIDKKAASYPDLIVVNSQEVKKRVVRYYKRNAVVIYPPVDLPIRFKGKRKANGYYIAHSRLVSQKGIELAVETATKYSLPLVVIGEGYLRSHLERIAGETVIFKGWVKETEIAKIYSRAKALIYCAIDEDFGIVPIEAMGFGIPVIAFKSGGVKETVVDGKTGKFFTRYTPESLYRAIKKLEAFDIDSQNCRIQAEKFNQKRFRREIIDIVNKRIHEEKR